jgi:uncharacterized protein with HEPN domain
MQREIQKYLYDIRAACNKILQYTAGKRFDDYCTDSLLRSGVERQIEIIGEATNCILKSDPDVVSRIPGHKRMISMRNRLIHGYSSVDDGIV